MVDTVVRFDRRLGIVFDRSSITRTVSRPLLPTLASCETRRDPRVLTDLPREVLHRCLLPLLSLADLVSLRIEMVEIWWRWWRYGGDGGDDEG